LSTRAPRLTHRRRTRRADSLDQVAATLRAPAEPRRTTLDEVASELRSPSRRKRGATLDQVAAQLRDPAPAAPLHEPLDFALPARPIRVEVISGRGHYDRVIAAVTNAHTSVWIATANAKELMVDCGDLVGAAYNAPRARPGKRRTHRRNSYVSIFSLLDDLAARGVELRMLHAEIPSGPFREELARHPRLVAGGLELRRCPRVHMKLVIVDGELVYLGSANWTGAGLGAKGSGRRNFELGMVTDDVELLDQVQAIYERVWSGGECEACKLREACPGPLIELVPRLITATPPAKKRMPARSQIKRRRVPRLI
jgi:phosphatidylserine/phosphatidylglycerophosphate/cardiolipin synthase-like enzyme